jgi:hypothetical protein
VDARIVIVDIGTGRSWYPSRLFALAAAVDQFGDTEVIVLLARRGGVDRYFLGWIGPSDIVHAMVQQNPAYAQALKRARTMLLHLRLYADDPNHIFAQPFDFASQLMTAYHSNGELAFVPALIHELQQPADPPIVPTQIEDPANPSWLMRDDIERFFDPWLVRTHMPADGGNEETLAMLARTPDRFIAVTEHERYVGMVDIDAFVRQVALQPPVSPRSG